MPLVVHGDERFLHQILHLVGQAGKPLAQEGAQMRAQVPQEGVIRLGVAGKAPHEQGPQTGFARTSAISR